MCAIRYSEKHRTAEEGANELRKELASLRESKRAVEEVAEVAREDHAKALAELENAMNDKISEEKSRTMDLRNKLMEKRSVLMKYVLHTHSNTHTHTHTHTFFLSLSSSSEVRIVSEARRLPLKKKKLRTMDWKWCQWMDEYVG